MDKLIRTFTGSDAEVWLGGDQLATLSKIDISVNGKFEDVTVCGDYRTYPVYGGYSVEGSVTIYKIDSTIQKKWGRAYRTGIMPDIKIITKLRDKATGKSERYVIHNVVFKNFDILNCESQKPIEQNVSIQAVDFEPLEEI